MKNISKVIENAGLDKKTVTVSSGLQVKNVSIKAATEGKKVQYWATLTLKGGEGFGGVDAMVVDQVVEDTTTNTKVTTYKPGKSSTVIVPLGTLMTVLLEGLDDMVDSDNAFELAGYGTLLRADAERQANSPSDTPYVSVINSLVRGAHIEVITRKVKKGTKVKSLFSLNDTEHDVVNDSFWHDIANLSNIRESAIANALAQVKADNKAAKDNKTSVAIAGSNVNAILAALAQQTPADKLEASLGLRG